MNRMGVVVIGAGLLLGATACNSDGKSSNESLTSVPAIATTISGSVVAPDATLATATLPPVTLAPLTLPPVTLAPISSTPITTSPASLPSASSSSLSTVPASDAPASTENGGPVCDLAIIVVQTETGFEGSTPSELHCTAEWAAWTGSADDPTASDGFFAVAQWDGATWQLRNLGTSGVCTDAAVPLDLWPSLRCFE